jgi:hypothetical protein
MRIGRKDSSLMDLHPARLGSFQPQSKSIDMDDRLTSPKNNPKSITEHTEVIIPVCIDGSRLYYGKIIDGQSHLDRHWRKVVSV